MRNMWIVAVADGDDVITSELTNPAEPVTTTGTGTGADGAPAVPQEAPPKPHPLIQFGPIIVIFIIMYFLMFRGPKKKQQQHQKMVSSLAKNARIRTIGGIFGTVLDVRDDEIVIKIDESTNTKMRISPSAVATVLGESKTD